MSSGKIRLIRVIATAWLGLLMLFAIMGILSGGASIGALFPPPATPSPVDPPVALVEDQPIRRSFWMEAVLLDWAMSHLAGVPAPSPEETLERLINEMLVLRAAPPLPEPGPDEVEAQIEALETTWGVTEEQVAATLGEVGLNRKSLERSIARLLRVQRAQAILESQGTPIQKWLAQERARARVVIYREQLRVRFRFPTPVITPTP
jgi:hypothetical protein